MKNSFIITNIRNVTVLRNNWKAISDMSKRTAVTQTIYCGRTALSQLVREQNQLGHLASLKKRCLIYLLFNACQKSDSKVDMKPVDRKWHLFKKKTQQPEFPGHEGWLCTRKLHTEWWYSNCDQTRRQKSKSSEGLISVLQICRQTNERHCPESHRFVP